MSSSDQAPHPMQATPWALDELPMPDIFSYEPPAPREETPAVDLHALHAAERTRAEAAAYSTGYRDAEAAAREAMASQFATAFSALAEAAESVTLHASRWTANAEENIAALAVIVAQSIIQHEVRVDQSIVRELVQRALVQFPIDQTIAVRLHPDDIASCEDLERTGPTGQRQDVRLVADQHIVRGGCLAEGRERIIDGRVDTALERAYRNLGQVEAS